MAKSFLGFNVFTKKKKKKKESLEHKVFLFLTLRCLNLVQWMDNYGQLIELQLIVITYFWDIT